VGNPLECGLSISTGFSTGDHKFATSKEEHNNIWVIKPIDKAGELFRFVLDLFSPKSDRNRVEVEGLAKVGT
jgi:hypothetical protein